MSFSFGGEPRKKKVKKHSQTQKDRKRGKRANTCTSLDLIDDGFESFVSFSSTVKKENPKRSKIKNSYFIPAPKRSLKTEKTLSMNDVIAKLSAKELARKSAIPSVTPISKSAPISKKMSRKVSNSNRNSSSKSKSDGKRNSTAGSQKVHPFFVKASELKASTNNNSITEPNRRKVSTAESHTEKSDNQTHGITKTFTEEDNTKITEPSIFSSVLPTETPLGHVESKPAGSISRIPKRLSDLNKSKTQVMNRHDTREGLNQQHASNKRHNSRNILLQLDRRSTFNSRNGNHFDSGYHGLRKKVHEKWSLNQTVGLDLGSQQGEVTCMEFDSEGILLAVADSVGQVSIFDFDEVNAADMSLKRKSTSHAHREKKNVPPFIRFSMGRNIHRISSMRWNPLDENVLAISFSNKDEVRLYDVSKVSNTGGNFFIRLAPTFNSNNIGNLVIKYLPPKAGQKHQTLLVGGIDGSLNLWTSSHLNCRRVWTIKPFKNSNGSITEIEHLPASHGNQKSGLVVAATSLGYFALIDTDRCSRKSFSSELTPQVLKTWSLSHLGGVRKHVLPSSSWMRVEKVYIWTDRPKMPTCNSPEEKILSFGVVTSGGWVISLHLEMAKDAVPKAHVLHRSPNIVMCDSSKSFTYNGDSTPSVPEFPSVHGKLDTAASLIVVTKTKTMYQVLPDSNKRVLESSGNISANSKEKDGLNIISRRGDSPITIPVEGKLKHLAVHPDNEWMVASMLAPNCGPQPSSTIHLMNLSSHGAAKTKRVSTK